MKNYDKFLCIIVTALVTTSLISLLFFGVEIKRLQTELVELKGLQLELVELKVKEEVIANATIQR